MCNHKTLFLLSLFLVFCLFLFGCNSFYDLSGESAQSSLIWIREDSHFVSYVIEDGIAFFEYELCFENQSDYDLTISTLGIVLSKNQTAGWIKHKNTFIAKEIQGKKH